MNLNIISVNSVARKERYISGIITRNTKQIEIET